ncbi:MAG: porin [Acidobacteria bacterium]|nr:porin [Acidobacteriota bacterium]
MSGSWISVLSTAALAGALFGFSPSATAQVTEPSRKLTVEERLDAIEQQLKNLERRLELVEGSPTASMASSSSQGSSDGNLQAAGVVERMEALDQQLRIVERRREFEAEATAAQAQAAPVVGAGSSGFFLRSADSAFAFNLRGNLQADTRLFPNGAPAAGASTLTITKVRPTFEGVVFKNFGFKFMSDFGSGATVLLDAYIDAAVQPWLKFRAGKFKGPVGLERLVSDGDVEFYERFLPTNLLPNRDVGAELFGDLWGGAVSYAGGIFNGVADGASTDLDTDNHREFEGRAFVYPFRKTTVAPVQGLGIGVAGTSGHKTGSVSAPIVAAYKTTAQSTFFRYRSDGTAAGTVVADGDHTRISPQANYYWGPLGAWGEYVLSSQQVRRGMARDTMDNAAWQVALTYVLTGESASYRGVNPAHPFGWKQRNWGALEVVARYGQLNVDHSAFPLFADPLSSAAGARSWTLGTNWYINRFVKVLLNYEQTDFQAVTGGPKRKQERALLERFQVNF